MLETADDPAVGRSARRRCRAWCTTSARASTRSPSTRSSPGASTCVRRGCSGPGPRCSTRIRSTAAAAPTSCGRWPTRPRARAGPAGLHADVRRADPSLRHGVVGVPPAAGAHPEAPVRAGPDGTDRPARRRRGGPEVRHRRGPRTLGRCGRPLLPAARLGVLVGGRPRARGCRPPFRLARGGRRVGLGHRRDVAVARAPRWEGPNRHAGDVGRRPGCELGDTTWSCSTRHRPRPRILGDVCPSAPAAATRGGPSARRRSRSLSPWRAGCRGRTSPRAGPAYCTSAGRSSRSPPRSARSTRGRCRNGRSCCWGSSTSPTRRGPPATCTRSTSMPTCRTGTTETRPRRSSTRSSASRREPASGSGRSRRARRPASHRRTRTSSAVTSPPARSRRCSCSSARARPPTPTAPVQPAPTSARPRCRPAPAPTASSATSPHGRPSRTSASRLAQRRRTSGARA